jgi:son of sevenless-like protein
VFFLTFRTFATADEIFSMLVGRYELPPPDGISIQEIDEWRERKLRPTQNRVLMCLTTWLEDYSMLNEDPHVARQMQEFLSLIQQPPQLALAARLILESLSRLVSDDLHYAS